MAIERIEHLAPLRARIAEWRQGGLRVALVPTMGNLHGGHLTLVREAMARTDRVVVSVFVNPLQFAPGEDYAAYPRTEERDRAMLDRQGVDVLFAPSVQTVYPRGQAAQTRVEVPGVSDILCGASRPGHFAGVATVVCKLFNMVQPHVALFGEKDYQQLQVIRQMTEDLCLPIEIRGVATVREADGLAMSSRNAYLSPDERSRAPALFRALERAAARLHSGSSIGEIEALALTELADAGLQPDYVSVRRAVDLAPPVDTDCDLVVLGAAYLGRARLIDNLRVIRNPR